MKKRLLILVLVLCAMLVTVSNAAITEHSVLPDSINAADVGGGQENPITSGLNFSVNTPGKLTKVRLWVAAGRSGLHTVSIWDVDTGTKLTGPFNWTIENVSNDWAYFTLPNALDIQTGKSYGVVISDNTSTWMSALHGYWTNHTPSSDVFVTYHRGFSGAADVLPTNWNTDGTYMVDVVFTTGEADPEPTTPPSTEPASNPSTSDSSVAFIVLIVMAASAFFMVRRLTKENA